MAQLDPVFHDAAKRLVDGMIVRDPFAEMSDILNSPTWLIEEIEGLEGDIRSWESTIEHNRKEIPALYREILTCERDAAIAKLRLIELRAKLRTALAATTGGAA